MTFSTHSARLCLAHHPRLWLVRCLLFVLALLAALLPASSFACGLPLRASIPAEQALITFANGREEIITSVHLREAATGAAVIFPVPQPPEVSVVEGDLFGTLDAATKPTVQVQERIVWRRDSGVGAPASGVQVLGRDVIGGYDVARVASADAAALQRWLEQNDYTIPAAATPILQQYANEGWTFVAVKLADARADGMLKPLRLSFPSDRIVYPMRLGALAPQPLDVRLYVASAQRVDIAGMTTDYAGPVAQLAPALPAELAALLRAPYLTRLSNSQVAPASLQADFVAQPAASNASFRRVVTETREVNGWDRLSRPIVLLALLAAGNVIVVSAALFLWRRLNAIEATRPAARPKRKRDR